MVSGLIDGSTFVQLPDVATTLAFRRTASGESAFFVVGPRTRGRYHPGKNAPICLRLRLRPGVARALFGLPVSELADRTVRITDLWGSEGARLTATLTDAGGDTELMLTPPPERPGRPLAARRRLGSAGGGRAGAFRSVPPQ